MRLIGWFVALCLAPAVQSLPYRLINTGRAFCWNIEAPKDTFIKVLYDAPDLVLDEGDPNFGPSYLTITEHVVTSALEEALDAADRGRRHRNRDAINAKTRPVTHEFKARQGFFTHRVKNDSELDLCIRSSTAGRNNAMRYGLRVEEMGDEEDPDSFQPPVADVDQHLSFMEQQFVRIESQMHALLKEADFARERDSIYHAKTDAMNKATIFWPILHVCILLATGFTQANHIVQFFKKRRII